MRVPFPSAEHAVKVKRVIDVDGELRPEISRRQLSVEDKELVLYVLSRAGKLGKELTRE